jgi:hypothetical protein
MMQDIFPLMALEYDGELNTHFSKLRKVINQLQRGMDLDSAMYSANLTELTAEDIMYIEREMGVC